MVCLLKQNKPETVDQYIRSAALPAQPVMQKLRALIRTTVPDAQETIRYGVPFYLCNGEFVGFAAYSKHVSFGYGSNVLTEALESGLKQGGYRLGKGTLQIRFDQDMPEREIAEILNRKAEQNRKSRT
jgi:uncharacterized protein YdhG (YjbR/CyaY superfamily)